jgi:hypothetical protein
MYGARWSLYAASDHCLRIEMIIEPICLRSAHSDRVLNPVTSSSLVLSEGDKMEELVLHPLEVSLGGK